MTLGPHALEVRTGILRPAMLMVFLGAGALVTKPRSVPFQAGDEDRVAPSADVAAAKPKVVIGSAPDSRG